SQRLLGEVLRPHAELVLGLAADSAQLRDVLRGLAHRDVDIGDGAVLAGIVPGLRTRAGPLHAARLRLGKDGAVRVRPAVAAAGREPADALHARGDEQIAL